jgi:hypothetical protein
MLRKKFQEFPEISACTQGLRVEVAEEMKTRNQASPERKRLLESIASQRLITNNRAKPKEAR